MKKSRLLKKLTVLVVVFALIVSNFAIANAYVLLDESTWLLFPKNIKVYITSTLEDDIAMESSIKTWQTYTDGTVRFFFTPLSPVIEIYDCRSADNDAYAVTYVLGASDKDIMVYKPINNLTTVQKNETIVHEMGHALGLNHITLAQNQSTSVMRPYGFNNKAYPLADDIAGINAMYG